MAIRRRSTLARESESDHRLRHLMLKPGSNFNTVWNAIKVKPDCTSQDLKKLGAYYHPQVLADLIHEGLVIKTGKRNSYVTYRVVEENITGAGRDRVDIDITVFRNEFGEFSISAKLLGEMPGAATEGSPVPVVSKRFKVLVPRPSEPSRTRQVFDLQTSAKPKSTEDSKASAKEPLIIEGEFRKIDGN